MEPQPVPRPQPQPTGQWKTDFWRVTPCNSFWNSFFCPCIIFSQTNERMRDPTLSHFDKNNDECSSFAVLHGSLCGGFLSVMKQRKEIRERYDIPGTERKDCLASFFCMCCAQVQHDEEIKLRCGSQDMEETATDEYKSEAAMAMTVEHK